MKLLKWQLYFFGLAILLTAFIAPRLYWLQRSVTTKAVVLYINETRRIRSTHQTYPVFEYHTATEIITSPGHYNLPYQKGDSVIIRYDPSIVTDFKINDFMGKWIDTIFWLAPILFVWTVFFLPKDFKPAITFTNGKIKFTSS
jgi:hypothetical protein